MRTIIAGSRSISDRKLVDCAAQDCGWKISEVVSGCAYGADALGEEWALRNNIPIKKFPADWAKWGRSAGMIRNAEMLRHADALIAIWDGKSRGTANMIKISEEAGIKIYIKKCESD
jgi:hypothetical protein